MASYTATCDARTPSDKPAAWFVAGGIAAAITTALACLVILI